MFLLNSINQVMVVGGGSPTSEPEAINTGRNWFRDDNVQIGNQFYVVPAEDRTVLEYLAYALVPGLVSGCIMAYVLRQR